MNLPENYIESMRQLLGEEELQNYLACFDAPRTYGLRVNTGKISVEEFLKRTSFHLTPVPWVENGFFEECPLSCRTLLYPGTQRHGPGIPSSC